MLGDKVRIEIEYEPAIWVPCMHSALRGAAVGAALLIGIAASALAGIKDYEVGVLHATSRDMS